MKLQELIENNEDFDDDYAEFMKQNPDFVPPIPPEEKMEKYIDDKGDNQKWVTINKIIVPTLYDKEQLLLALEYIHNLREVDTYYLAVNSIIHVYENPELIEVE